MTIPPTSTTGYTEQMPDSPSPACGGKAAAAPFNRTDADFILRSSDDVEFRVHHLILSLASSVFDGMFSMPRPPALSSDPPVPELSISEDSETLDLFLRICYPLIDPEVATLPLLRKVLTAAIKYDAPMVVHAMKRELRQPRFMDQSPVRVFAIACLCDLEEEARIAAEKAVIANVVGWHESHCPELDEISAGAYYRLLKLNHTRVKQKAKKCQRVKQTVTVDFHVDGILPLCGRRDAAPVRTPTATTVMYPESISLDGADVILRTSDSDDFFVHRALITWASPTFLDSLRQSRVCNEPRSVEDERPIYSISEDSATVDILLRMCYPVDLPDIPSAALYLDAAFAAHKYRFRRVEQTLLRSWSDYAQNAPLRFYFAAVQCGWETEARACALRLTTTLSPSELNDAYVPEMETASSVQYRRLLSYAQACREAATKAFELRDLPGRLCPPERRCHQRYPTTLSTNTTQLEELGLFWLSPRFSVYKSALALKPSGDVLMSHLEMVSMVLDNMDADESCNQTLPGPVQLSSIWTTSPARCTKDSKINWVIDLMRKYGAAVDKAVSEVKLEILGSEMNVTER